MFPVSAGVTYQSDIKENHGAGYWGNPVIKRQGSPEIVDKFNTIDKAMIAYMLYEHITVGKSTQD